MKKNNFKLLLLVFVLAHMVWADWQYSFQEEFLQMRDVHCSEAGITFLYHSGQNSVLTRISNTGQKVFSSHLPAECESVAVAENTTYVLLSFQNQLKVLQLDNKGNIEKTHLLSSIFKEVEKIKCLDLLLYKNSFVLVGETSQNQSYSTFIMRLSSDFSIAWKYITKSSIPSRIQTPCYKIFENRLLLVNTKRYENDDFGSFDGDDSDEQELYRQETCIDWVDLQNGMKVSSFSIKNLSSHHECLAFDPVAKQIAIVFRNKVLLLNKELTKHDSLEIDSSLKIYGRAFWKDSKIRILGYKSQKDVLVEIDSISHEYSTIPIYDHSLFETLGEIKSGHVLFNKTYIAFVRQVVYSSSQRITFFDEVVLQKNKKKIFHFIPQKKNIKNLFTIANRESIFLFFHVVSDKSYIYKFDL